MVGDGDLRFSQVARSNDDVIIGNVSTIHFDSSSAILSKAWKDANE